MSEAVDFFDLLKNKNEVKEEESSEEVAKEVVEEKPKTTKKSTSIESYEYPFSLYTEGKVVDISEYGFEDKKKYTPKQICDVMLKHRHYEFAGEMTFKMFDDDNMLVATAKQYKKG